MYRSILVPLDGSPLSEYALPLSCDLARRSGATLCLMHIHRRATPVRITVEGLLVIDEDLLSLAKAHARAYLEHMRELSRRQPPSWMMPDSTVSV